MIFMSDTITDPTTVVRHVVADTPEQKAADVLSAAFAALSAVPARTPEDTARLAEAQRLVVLARRHLGDTWPIV